MTNITLRPFEASDQNAVRLLILDGLSQRFSELRPELVPDINDIQSNYIDQGASVMVAEDGEKIIGCGMLIKENGSDEIARIVRMSVDSTYQRQGIGRKICQTLLEIARLRRFNTVLVETNHNWESALTLYQSMGFRIYKEEIVHERGYTEIHMQMNL